MTRLIPRLLYELDAINNGGDEDVLREMVDSWRGRTGVRIIRELLLEWLQTSADIAHLRAAARESSTHYIWPIHLGNNGYSVTINEFKSPQDMVPGYATVLHNHRYSFISLILSGGYSQVRCDVQLAESCHVIQVHELGEDLVTEGDIIVVNHNEFHRLGTVNNGTVTLVVKCPAVKGESLSVDTNTLRVTKHVPVEARIRQLMTALASATEKRR